MDAIHNCAKCDLPLAEQIYQLSCQHKYHEACLALFLKKFSTCATCRGPIKNNITVLDTLPDEDENCPICCQSIAKTVERLGQQIFQHENGKLFHQDCFPEGSSVQAQISARDYLAQHPTTLPQVTESAFVYRPDQNEERATAANTYVDDVTYAAISRMMNMNTYVGALNLAQSPGLPPQPTLSGQDMVQNVVEAGKAAYRLWFPNEREDQIEAVAKDSAKRSMQKYQAELDQITQLLNSIPIQNQVVNQPVPCDESLQIAIAVVALFLLVSAIAYIMNLALFAGADPILHVIGLPIGSILNLLG